MGTLSSTGHYLQTFLSGGAGSVSDLSSPQHPEELTKNGGLYRIDEFAKRNIATKDCVIAIGGEERKNPFYPSHTIAQMALWAMRQKEDFGSTVTVSLNLAPALKFNGIDESRFYSEKEQKERIILDMLLMGASAGEIERIRFQLSTENQGYLSLLDSISQGDIEDHRLYRWLHEEFLKHGEFFGDIRKCVPDGAITLENRGKEVHYALIEIHEIILDYLSGCKIKIGFKRERFYDRIVQNILDGKYPGLTDLTESLNPTRPDGSRADSSERFGSVYWSDAANENGRKLRMKGERALGIKRVLCAVPFLVSAIISGETMYRSYSDFKQSADLTAALSESLEKKRISMPLGIFGVNLELSKSEEKLLKIEKLTHALIEGFEIRYGKIEDPQARAQVAQLLMSESLKSTVSEVIEFDINAAESKYQRFIDDFVKGHRDFFRLLGITPVLYKNLAYLEPEMKRMITGSRIPKAFDDSIALRSGSDFFRSDEYRAHVKHFSANIVYDHTKGKRILLHPPPDTKIFSGISESERVEFLKESQFPIDVAYDYFWQTRSTLKELYHAVVMISFDGSVNEVEVEPNFLKNLLIRAYLENASQIESGVAEKGLNRYLLEDFYPAYTKLFLQNGVKLGIPYAKFLKNRDAFENTLTHDDPIPVGIAFADCDTIGLFKSSDGTEYFIGAALRAGRPYMVYSPRDHQESVYFLTSSQGKVLASEILTLLKLKK